MSRPLDVKAGDSFGAWTVLDPHPNAKHPRRYVLVRCSCGIEKQVCLGNLVQGLSVCCRECATKVILVGKVFGKLTAIKQEMVEGTKTRSKHLCRCECGRERWVLTQNLMNGHTTTCGESPCSQKGPQPDLDKDIRDTLNQYKKGAVSRGYGFSLSYEQFCELIKKDCWYCGKPPAIRDRKKQITRAYATVPQNGIDRVDNSKGYSVDNCVPCCSRCNRAKDTMTQAEFLGLIRLIAVRHP